VQQPFEFSVNDTTAPTATDDSYTMNQGTSLVLTPLTKGVNDSDTNDSDLHIFSINGVTLLVLNGNDIQTIEIGTVGGVVIWIWGNYIYTGCNVFWICNFHL
jgi:hypothetical protein